MAVGDNKIWFDDLTKCAMKALTFDDVAIVNACHNADVNLCSRIRPSLRKANMYCRDTMGVRGISQMEDEIDWSGLYNTLVGEIIEQYDLDTYVDEWGAYCWEDAEGVHCGDSSGFYPFYLMEDSLRDDLDMGRF